MGRLLSRQESDRAPYFTRSRLAPQFCPNELMEGLGEIRGLARGLRVSPDAVFSLPALSNCSSVLQIALLVCNLVAPDKRGFQASAEHLDHYVRVNDSSFTLHTTDVMTEMQM